MLYQMAETIAHAGNKALAKQFMLLADVVRERDRQDEKFGVQNHAPLTWSAILAEECGEVAKAALNFEAIDPIAYRIELEQVAAVALAAIECLDRDKWR